MATLVPQVPDSRWSGRPRGGGAWLSSWGWEGVLWGCTQALEEWAQGHLGQS